MTPDLQDMDLFVRAVAAGSLSAAGRELGLTPAVASKRLARLEAHLGARLLQRSSRRLSLTDDGALYLERCQAILADVAAAEALLGGDGAQVRGTLRVSATSALGRRWVGPVAADFVARHPELTLQLSLTDRLVDLVESGTDCAVRIGPLAGEGLVSRRLAENRRVVCATPGYLRAHGTPATPQELARHAWCWPTARRRTPTGASARRKVMRPACGCAGGWCPTTASRCTTGCWPGTAWRGARSGTSPTTWPRAAWWKCSPRGATPTPRSR